MRIVSLIIKSLLISQVVICSSFEVKQSNLLPQKIKSTISKKTKLFHNENENQVKILTTKRGGAQSLTTSQSTKRQKLTVLLVALALFNDVLQITMLLPIIHTLVTSPPPLGVESNAELALGVFFASKDICQMTFAPLASWVCSKTSATIALFSSTAALGLATFVFAQATTFWQLLLARGAQGMASAAVMCGGFSLIAETHPSHIRGSAIGMAQSGLALGLLGGPLIGGLLFQKFGRRATFRLASFFVLLNALSQLLLMKFAPPEKIIIEEKEESSKKKDLMHSWKLLLRNRDILVVALSTLVIHAVLGVVKPLSQVILDTEFGVSMINRSLIISIATVAFFISTPISGYLSDCMSKSHLVSTSLLLMSLSCVFFALREIFGLRAFHICIGLLGTSLGIAGSSSQSLLADLVDKNKLGEYSIVYALSDVADSVGLIVGPVMGLYLSQVFSPSVGVLSIGVLCILLAPFVLRIK